MGSTLFGRGSELGPVDGLSTTTPPMGLLILINQGPESAPISARRVEYRFSANKPLSQTELP